jgi:hypothetical protein
VTGLDRQGEPVCDATVVSVRRFSKTDGCFALTVSVPKRFVHDVRHIRRRA